MNELRQRIKRRVLTPLGAPYRRFRDRHVFQSELRPSDMFLVGHPKSGNTWLAYMLAILLYGEEREKVTLTNINHLVPTIHGRDSCIGSFPNLPAIRIFRNEWPMYPELYPKTLYLVRDPRAALVSLHHMYNTIFHEAKMPMDDFLEEYMLHGCVRKWEPKLTRWDRQVSTWLDRAQYDERVLIVRYEDMVSTRREVLHNAARFAGIPHSSEKLESAVAKGTFSAMRSLEDRYGAESYPGDIGARGHFIRQGTTDGWRDELLPRQSELIAREFAAAMVRAGYLP